MSEPIEMLPGYRPLEMTGAVCIPDAHGHCASCSDEALPARVISLDADLWLALVEMEGRELEVDVSLVDDPRPGALLLVHGGVALGRIEESR